MRVTVTGGVGDLARDLSGRSRELGAGARRIAYDAAKDGERSAKRIARFRYGKGHAREYAGKISTSRSGRHRVLLGSSSYAYEYGPELRGQGMLGSILERGSINNSAHHNLDQSADLMRPGLHRSVDSLLDGIFGRGD